MNVEEIKIQAQLQICMQIPLQYVIRFVNEGINELGITYDTACERGTFITDITKDIWIDLPRDFIEAKEVKINGLETKQYEIDNNQIRCSNNGNLEMRFLKLADNVTSKTDIPNIHLAYHYPLTSFVASREKSRLFGDEDNESLRLMNDFFRKSAMAHARIRKKGGRIRI